MGLLKFSNLKREGAAAERAARTTTTLPQKCN
jgi:hypothetical protein